MVLQAEAQAKDGAKGGENVLSEFKLGGGQLKTWSARGRLRAYGPEGWLFSTVEGSAMRWVQR